jgi:hypothetical protein
MRRGRQCRSAQLAVDTADAAGPGTKGRASLRRLAQQRLGAANLRVVPRAEVLGNVAWRQPALARSVGRRAQRPARIRLARPSCVCSRVLRNYGDGGRSVAVQSRGPRGGGREAELHFSQRAQSPPRRSGACQCARRATRNSRVARGAAVQVHASAKVPERARLRTASGPRLLSQPEAAGRHTARVVRVWRERRVTRGSCRA